MHHRFDDSPDDYDMDMDQRTRMLGRGGRIILLGDGTEIVAGHGGDDDVDMEDRVTEVDDASLEETDEEAVQRNQQKNNEDRSQREGTPAPPTAGQDSNTQQPSGQSGVVPEKILPVLDDKPSASASGGQDGNEKTK